MKKLIILLAIAAIFLAAHFLGIDNYLTLDGLKHGVDQLQTLNATQPWLVVGIFSGIYVVLTAVSFPGAAVMTLGAGALFGVVGGTIVVSFASTIGATLAFLASRYLLRDYVEKKFGSRLKSFNAGVEKEGAFYLFTLRLAPVVPFSSSTC